MAGCAVACLVLSSSLPYSKKKIEKKKKKTSLAQKVPLNNEVELPFAKLGIIRGGGGGVFNFSQIWVEASITRPLYPGPPLVMCKKELSKEIIRT